MINELKSSLKSSVPSSVKTVYKRYKKTQEKRYSINRYKHVTSQLIETRGKKRIILIGTSVYGNLGDQAISIAEITFLKDFFSAYPIIEIPNAHYVHQNKVIKENITNKDVLVINGGGFLGTLWIAGENMARDIVKHFEENKIVILPQTIFFSNDEKGMQELEISKSIYQNHPDITIFVRDKASYEFANKKLKGKMLQNIKLVPDIVTYLNKNIKSNRRKNVLFCLRSDKEKINNQHQLSFIKKALDEKNISDIVYQDTVVEDKIDLLNRDEELEKMLEYFYDAKLVITDRLHGMILSAITGTPCIALNNISGKVKGAYEWIDYLDYIQYVDKLENIGDYVDELLSLDNPEYNNNRLKDYYSSIAESICPENK